MDTSDRAAELSRRATINEVAIAWDRYGADDGSPLVLCHGFSGSGHDFALVVDDLAERRPVLVLDQRGHGRSEKLGRVDAYAIDQLADDLAAWLGEVSDGPVHLLGHSLGGRVVQQTTLAHPELVESLILMDTSAAGFSGEGSQQGQIMAAFLAKYDPARGLPDMTSMRGPEDDLIDERTPLAWRQRKAELSAAFDPYALKALGDELLALGNDSLLDALSTVGIPVTVIVGSLDAPLVAPAHAIAAAVPGSTLEIIDGAYHSPQLTHAAEWVAAVEGHLSRA